MEAREVDRPPWRAPKKPRREHLTRVRLRGPNPNAGAPAENAPNAQAENQEQRAAGDGSLCCVRMNAHVPGARPLWPPRRLPELPLASPAGVRQCPICRTVIRGGIRS